MDYKKLGVKTIINAAGTYTKYGGSLVADEVIQAMEKASKNYVDIDDLLKKSGNYLADLLGVESTLITSGAAAGLVLASAACMAGGNKKHIEALPRTEEVKNEIIVMKCHRNPYDQAVRTAGAEFVEVGNAIETHPWQIESAISEKTAAIIYFAQSALFRASLPLSQVIDIGKRNDIPVIVDAAAELPPADNLTRFYEMGADIVLFSGGKDLRGPQSSGLMVGRKEFIDKCRYHSYPHHAVGRPMKLDKETIMGLVRAIELYLEEDQQKRMEKWSEMSEKIALELDQCPVIKATVGYPDQPLTQPASIPRVFVEFEKNSGLCRKVVADKLMAGEPGIAVVVDNRYLIINPHMLKEREVPVVIDRIKEIIEV
ncbi:MAG: aminotransferase class V-fold PLP-dependent enzyme [Halanaerobiales bacterium]